jgi:hypothetical protein
MTKLCSFVTYYNKTKIKAYIKILIDNQFLIKADIYNSHQLYCISPIGIEVIEELNNSYEVQLLKFYTDNSISL